MKETLRRLAAWVMSLLMMSFNLMADGLHEALDPKMKSM